MIPEPNISVNQKQYNYQKYENVLNRPPDGIASYAFTELRRRVVVKGGAILYTSVMFLRQWIYLINKIKATVLPSYHIFLEKNPVYRVAMFVVMSVSLSTTLIQTETQ